jgi:two-component system sensor histidine kinase BaeS
MISIDKQLRRYFVIVTILAVLVIFVLSNLGMTVFFNSYVRQTDLKSDQKIVQYIEDLFPAENNITMGNFTGLLQFIRGEEVEVKLFDSSGVLILDTSSMANMHRGMGHGGGMGSSPGMVRGPGMSRQPGEQETPASDLVFKEYPLQADGNVIGKVEIGREKTVLASAEDRTFFITMNLVFVIALVLSIFLVLVLSKYVTGKFLKPLLTVKNNIQAITSHGQEKQQPVSSKTIEIQELVLATEELAQTIKEQDKLRKRLTSDVAHELRTPLATLQSHLEAMIDGIWEATPARLSFCYDELIRLTRLINDLNELSVIESDKIQLNKTEVGLSKLLNEMLENFRLLFEEKNIAVTANIQQGIIVRGDNDRLRQIFVNILSNANKYTPEHGRVIVNLGSEPSWAVTEIRDTGKGISSQDLAHIFERFYRGDLSRSRESGGAGIGLTIAKAMVEAHQGTLEVESELGVGTIVRIRLPIYLS